MALKDLPGYKSPVDATQSVKETEKKIADLTTSLQEELKTRKDALKTINKHNKALPAKVYNNKDNHTFMRYQAWVDSGDGSEGGWIIDDGPLRDLVGDVERYRTVEVRDSLDNLYENFIWDNEGLRGTDLENSLYSAETVEDYEKAFSAVPPNLREDAVEAKKEIETVMLNVIDLNVSSFEYDW